MSNLDATPEPLVPPWMPTGLVPWIEPSFLPAQQSGDAANLSGDPESDAFLQPLTFEPLQAEVLPAPELLSLSADPLTGLGSGAISTFASITGGGPPEFGGSIAAPGEQDIYTFTGTAGQQLVYDGLIATAGIGVRLTNPSGVTLFNSANATSDQLLRLSETGTHQLVIDGTGQATGEYLFRILDTEEATALTLGDTVSGRLDPGTGDRLYRFTGTSGQKLFFDQLSGGGSSSVNTWSIYGPGDQLVANNSLASDRDVFALPADGSYLMVVYGNESAPVDFQFRLLAAQTTFQVLPLGPTAVSGTLANPGD